MPKSKYSTGLEGQRFNRTIIVSFSHQEKECKGFRYYWKCLCDCGTEHIADARAMFRGMVQSCGCLGREKLELRTKHGHTRRGKRTPECTSWHKLRQRIYNPRQKWFHLYGGRGLRCCEGFNDFSNFLRVVGPRPLNCSIDRINNEGHYSCGQCDECAREGWKMNVRWATTDEQNGNKRNTIFLTFGGKRLPLFWWAKQIGLPRWRLYHAYRKSEVAALNLLMQHL